jgi:hypothetical protein
MRLKNDVFSYLKPQHVYGRKGDKVQIIRDCENVLIVENTYGNRFPVPPELITYDEENETAANDRVPDLVQTKDFAVPGKNKPHHRRSVSDDSQSSLF